MSVPARDPRKIARGIRRFGSPWKLTVLAYLDEKPLRFNDILRMGEEDGLNARTLSRVLKALEGEGFVHREVLPTRPLAVEYSRTGKGQRLARILDGFRDLEDDPELRDVQL